MIQKRQQLTLFIDASKAITIEKIRKTYNPQQFALIAAHVTLCREDELLDIEKVLLNLTHLNLSNVTIVLGQVTRFSEGNGVLIPAIGNNISFHALRKQILRGIINNSRRHEPHITLIHPRNATCTDEIFEKIEKIALPQQITFKKISLIEQEIGQKWTVLREFRL